MEYLHAEKHPVSGAWLVSALWDGYIVRRTYFDYTKKEAIALFRQEMNQGSRNRAIENNS